MRRASAPGGPLHQAAGGGGGGGGLVGGQPPPGALGCLQDVAALVQGLRPVVLCALTDAERLLGTAVAALSSTTAVEDETIPATRKRQGTAANEREGCSGRRRVEGGAAAAGARRAAVKAMTRTARKVHFLTVWANEQSEEVYAELGCEHTHTPLSEST